MKTWFGPSSFFLASWIIVVLSAPTLAVEFYSINERGGADQVGAPVNLIQQFNAGFGIVAIGFDASSDHIYVKSISNGETREFTNMGNEVLPRFVLPGLTDDAAGFDFTTESVNIGGTTVPADTLLFFDGDEDAVGLNEIAYAVDKENGSILAEVVIGNASSSTNGTQSGAYHPGRNSLYILNWSTDTVRELDPITGTELSQFSVASHIDIFFGGIEVSQADGHVFLVSSTKNSIVELESDGTFVRELDLTSFGISSLSSISIDDQTGDAWLSTLAGDIYQISDVARAVSEPSIFDVVVDIKPGPSNNIVALNGNGTLQVAILANEEFDVLDIDIKSLLFGDPILVDGGATAMGATSNRLRDLNHDGLDDLLVGFSISDLVDGGALDASSVEGRLTGELFDGTPIVGSDIVRMVPQNNGGGPALVVQAIPEPSTLVLAALALFSLLAHGRRRRRA